MKKLLLLLMAVFTVFTINSCRDEIQGKDEDKNNAQFSFKVERDTDFIEKAVGETNDIKLNIKPNYKFEASKMYIKYTGDKNGVLKLGDLVLEQNKDYEVKNADNILKYTANEEGTHKIKVVFTNDRKQSVTEEFELKYAVSDFQVKLEGGVGDFFQGVDAVFNGKITPSKNSDTKGYIIKFNSFDGIVKLNDVQTELGKEYNLPNLDNFQISLNSKKVGAQKLSYTIKNSTVSRDLEAQINVKAREITIQSIDLKPSKVDVNTELTLAGFISKTLNKGTPIKYKTWISSSSNNNLLGIDNTQGSYVDYALSENGAFSIKMLAKAHGDYTLNFQAQDEYGNTSEVKTFSVKVASPIEVNSRGKINVFIYKGDNNWTGYGGINISDIKATSNLGAFARMDINIKFTSKSSGTVIQKKYTKYFDDNTTSLNLNEKFKEDFKVIWVGRDWQNESDVQTSIVLYDKNDNKIEFPHDTQFTWYGSYGDF
ncbi:TraQ conjugal transfer family protein [Elizabethkingia ursingii]